MKTLRICLFACLGFFVFACGSARKAEAERKRTEEKMEKLDKDKKDFERDNQRETR